MEEYVIIARRKFTDPSGKESLDPFRKIVSGDSISDAIRSFHIKHSRDIYRVQAVINRGDIKGVTRLL